MFLPRPVLLTLPQQTQKAAPIVCVSHPCWTVPPLRFYHWAWDPASSENPGPLLHAPQFDPHFREL